MIFIFPLIGETTNYEAKLLELSPNLSLIKSSGREINQTRFPFNSNCWNITMFTLGVTNTPYISSFTEIAATFDSSLCKVIKNKNLKFGDVLAFREIMPYSPDEFGKFKQHIINDRHTAVYLDENTVYSQNGVNEIIKIQPIKEVINIYLEKKYQNDECMGAFDFKKLRGKCFTILSYYRCQSLEDYINTNDAQIFSTKTIEITNKTIEIDTLELNLSLNNSNGNFKVYKSLRRNLIKELKNHIKEYNIARSIEEDKLLNLLSEKLQRVNQQR